MIGFEELDSFTWADATVSELLAWGGLVRKDIKQIRQSGDLSFSNLGMARVDVGGWQMKDLGRTFSYQREKSKQDAQMLRNLEAMSDDATRSPVEQRLGGKIVVVIKDNCRPNSMAVGIETKKIRVKTFWSEPNENWVSPEILPFEDIERRFVNGVNSSIRPVFRPKLNLVEMVVEDKGGGNLHLVINAKSGQHSSGKCDRFEFDKIFRKGERKLFEARFSDFVTSLARK